MLVNHNINNLSGGVSRQPDEARFDNQVEEMINFVPYVTGSIRRRNPLYSIGSISAHSDNMFIHSYDRGDGLEKYGIVLDDNGLRVYDTNGSEKTVLDYPSAISGNTLYVDGYANVGFDWTYVDCSSQTYCNSSHLVTFNPTDIDINCEAGTYTLQSPVSTSITTNSTVYINGDSGSYIRLTWDIFGGSYNNVYVQIGTTPYGNDIMSYTLPRTITDALVDIPTESIDSGDYYVTIKAEVTEKYGVSRFRMKSLQAIDATLPPEVSVLDSWSGTDWKNDIQMITVGDTTWVLNKSKTVQLTSSKTPSYTSNKAFYWIKRSFDNGSGGGYTYKIVVDGYTFETNTNDSLTAISNLSTDQDITSTTTLTGLGFKIKTNGSILRLSRRTHMLMSLDDVSANEPKRFVGMKETSTSTNTYYFDVLAEGCDICDKFNSGWYINTSDIGMVNAESLSNGASVNIVYYNESATATQIIARTYVYNASPEFTFEYSDSYGNQASIGWRDNIPKISDLPSKMDGFTESDVGVVAITGTDRDTFTNYYVKWDTDHWTETSREYIDDELDYKTLPAKLVRLSSGNFAFGFNVDLATEGFNTSWNKRKVGDDYSNPVPSFVGNKISNMFFFRNRLGFTSEENVILSEVGEYYNFFASTVMEVLDSDSIDVSVDSDTVSIIRNVNAISGSITLWADDGQFVLSGGDILSPSTTRVSKSSSYSCDNSLSPLIVDNEIIFFNRSGLYTEVMSYSASSLNTDKSSAESVSANVLGYLPYSINRAVVASASNMIFMLDSSNKKKMFVYKYHIKNNEKIMSSWFTWIFPEDIYDIDVLDNKLYLLCGTSRLASLQLDPVSIDNELVQFLDYGTTPYDSEVVMSKFNIETQQGTRIIREPFYMKSIKANIDGDCDVNIINYERDTVTTIATSHTDRKLFVGGNTDKVVIGFKSSYNTGCKINTISVEGLLKTRSKNG